MDHSVPRRNKSTGAASRGLSRFITSWAPSSRSALPFRSIVTSRTDICRIKTRRLRNLRAPGNSTPPAPKTEHARNQVATSGANAAGAVLGGGENMGRGSERGRTEAALGRQDGDAFREDRSHRRIGTCSAVSVPVPLSSLLSGALLCPHGSRGPSPRRRRRRPRDPGRSRRRRRLARKRRGRSGGGDQSATFTRATRTKTVSSTRSSARILRPSQERSHA
jgi:hypothetical protein